ncbi:CHAT domain-containing protein [Actinokineospora enzanensis]|uniref:CHAT domain-containing protein n=1 Tax=Actinokineospora enzanensis TaxID=155975 RepID=UPI0012EC2C81|nr:CHAT domain-containing protein [Actinokineospora enzanensis]
MRGWWRRRPTTPEPPPALWWDGDSATIDAAVEAARAVFLAVPRGHPTWSQAAELLSQRLLRRARSRATWSDADEAIAVLRELSAVYPESVDVLDALGHAFGTRYEWLRRLPDLDEALRHGRHAVNRTPVGDPEWPVRMMNLAASLRLRYVHTGAAGDLGSALSAAVAAVEASPPDSAHLPILRSNLSTLYMSEYESTEDPDDLAKAIEHARAAIAIEDEHNHAIHLSNLSVGLAMRFTATGEQHDLVEATELARRAVAATPMGDPTRGRHLAQLGNMLLTHWNLSGDPAVLAAVIATRREVLESTSVAPSLRITAAVTMASLLVEAGDTEGALAAWRSAVDLLPALAWHGLDLESRAQALGDVRGLAREACGAAVALGRPEDALELLERGQAVLWGQALRLRADLTGLTAAAPELAARLHAARAGLDDGTTDGEERLRLGRLWDEAVAEVRTLPGFADFLAPLPFARLREAAAHGPVVVVNHSGAGDHALIVTDRVEVVPLELDGLLERTNVYLEAMSLAAQAGGPDGFLVRERFRDVLTDMLAWLWERVAAPVFEALGPTGPRLWWCPTGILTFLPLHAAGVPGDHVPDRVISSYTTSLGDLLRARAARPPHEPRVLAVGAGALPGQVPLPEVRRELAGLAALLPDRLTTLTGAEARRAAVSAALREHSWLHLAGHTQPTPEEPTRTGVVLADGPLTVLDLADLRLEQAELAYLSACITMLGSGSLTDEALHLPAVLRLVGYRHVIAALWHVQDQHAAGVAAAVYQELVRAGRPCAEHAATALHQALAGLRETGHPVDWAPFVHMGP